MVYVKSVEKNAKRVQILMNARNVFLNINYIITNVKKNVQMEPMLIIKIPVEIAISPALHVLEVKIITV